MSANEHSLLLFASRVDKTDFVMPDKKAPRVVYCGTTGNWFLGPASLQMSRVKSLRIKIGKQRRFSAVVSCRLIT